MWVVVFQLSVSSLPCSYSSVSSTEIIAQFGLSDFSMNKPEDELARNDLDHLPNCDDHTIE